MNKTPWILALSACLWFGHAQAQSQEASSSQSNYHPNVCHYYKWTENGVTRYGRAVPRHVNQDGVCYRSVNRGYAVEVNDPASVESYFVLQPEAYRPESASNSGDGLADGAISKSERCRLTRAQIKLLTEKSTVYEEDGAGNLVPLAPEQVKERLEVARTNEAILCSE